MKRILLFIMALSTVTGCKSQADKDFAKLIKLCNNDRYSEAIQFADTCITRYPDEYKFYSERGFCHIQSRNIESARADIEKCLQLKSSSTRCMALMGLVNEAEGHFDAAENDLKTAIAREYAKSSKSLYYRYLGDFYYRSKKDVPKSIAQYTEALRLNKRNGAAYYNLGSVFFAVNEKEFAEQRWLKGLKIADYDETRFKHMTFYGLAYLYFERRDYWKAKEMIKKALELAPSNEQYLRFSKTITEQLKS
ncbi:MAG: tetratricopeptide repeat protein [Spirochaetes bacterium]|nr:tetratricopeptide repeat protein [Spirochaetota bacterium]